LAGCSQIRSAKLYAPTWFGFAPISERVYVDEQMPAPERATVLETIRGARDRVAAFFGGVTANPEIFVCATLECFESKGGVSTRAKSFGSRMILVSPRGRDTEIIAHELTHVELSSRIGDYRSKRAVPAWFHEGLAVLVSRDSRYSDETWLRLTANGRDAPKLDTLGFGRAVPWSEENWQLSYGTARRAVGEWYSCAGRRGLLRLLGEIKRGAKFTDVFGATCATTPSSVKDRSAKRRRRERCSGRS
jgi:hypothetical protein